MYAVDIDTVDALIGALTEFNGGVIMVSHDERLITHVADVLWVCSADGSGAVRIYDGDYDAFKRELLATDADA